MGAMIVRGRGQKEGGSVLVSTVLLLIACAFGAFVYVWFLMPHGAGQLIKRDCTVNGLGQGTCAFTNTGWSPGTDCTEVSLTNSEKQQGAYSGTICSGRVWPRDTVVKPVAIIVGDVCKDSHTYSPKPWTELCTMNVGDRN